MLKEAFSTLKSVVGASVKGAVSDYTPTASNMGGAFTRIAQQGIANLSYRSPILADIASTMLHSFQSELVHRDKIRSHVSSEDSNALRAAMTEKLGPDASKEKIDDSMAKVIDKMSKIVDVEGLEAAKKSEVFKEFGEYFKNFKKAPENQAEPSRSGESGDVSGTLGRIDTNTSKTAQLLAEMVPEGCIPGSAPAVNQPPIPDPVQGKGSSFIDPMTGLPSIKAAVGSIGGTFLAKVFDDDVITKYANKTKAKLFGADEEIVAEVKKPEVSKPDVELKPEPVVSSKKIVASKERQTDSIQEVLKGISLDLSTPALPESFAPIAATSSNEGLNESVSRETKRSESSNKLLEQIIEQLKKLNDKKLEPSADGEGSGFGLEDVLKSKASGLGRLGNIARGAARFAGPAAMVAGAGAAGYGAGTLLAPLIDKGITAASGEENTLGTWIYNKTHKDEGLEATKSIPPISAAKSKQISEIEKLQATKDSAVTKPNQLQTPVVLNTPVVTNNNSTTVIANASVRNQESTFERVQFQDFWRRVA